MYMNSNLHMEKIIQKTLMSAVVLLWTFACHAQDHWTTVNEHDYQYDMAVYCTLYHGKTGQLIPKEELDDYEVAAFINGECRGIGVLQNYEDNYWFYVRVYSNMTSSVQTITFKYYKKSEGIEREIDGMQLPFVSQGHEGTASTPVQLDIDISLLLGDANGDGEIDAIDFNIIGNHILGFGQSQFNAKAADINGDGEIDAIDFNMVANYILYGSYGGASASRVFIVENDIDPS